MFQSPPTESDRRQAARDGLAAIKAIRSGQVTNNQRRQAATIRERLDRGDMVSEAQVAFMELVEHVLRAKARSRQCLEHGGVEYVPEEVE